MFRVRVKRSSPFFALSFLLFFWGCAPAVTDLISQQIEEDIPLAKIDCLGNTQSREYMAQLLHKLVTAGERTKEREGYRACIIHSKSPLAITRPNGLITISSALIQTIESEGELAFVVAHE